MYLQFFEFDATNEKVSHESARFEIRKLSNNNQKQVMAQIWEENIDEFIKLSNKHKVRMLMVGGGAVNFHGYQRHSADVAFG